MKKIAKIKFGKDLITIHSEEDLMGEISKTVFSSSECPRKEFDENLQSLVPYLGEFLEFSRDYYPGIIINGLQFFWIGDNIAQVVISAIKELDSGHHFAFNSPRMTANKIQILPIILDEAKKYLAGERAQGELFNSIPA